MISTTLAGPRWRSRLTALGWGLSTIGFVACGSCLAYATVREAQRLNLVLPATPPEVTQDIVVRNVKDDAGRRAAFRILLFSDEFRWRLNSHHAVETVKGRPDFTDEMKAVLNDVEEIICVGTSSQEIASGTSLQSGRVEEEQRAARRAEQIAMWVRAALSKPVKVRKLHIGHHTPTGRAGDTSDQRRVVIILVLSRDVDTNIDQALRAAMERESATAPVFQTLLTQYSLAGGRTFKWIE